MGKFLDVKRETAGYRPREERLKDYREVEERLASEKIQGILTKLDAL